MKLKIIDLLNMISKGKEVPKKIKYCSVYYYWTGFNYENNEADDVLFWAYIYSEKYLNDDIEIIEDTPKISKLYINNKLQYDLAPKEDKKIKRIGKLNQVEDKQNLNNYRLRDKINEIIEKLNKEE